MACSSVLAGCVVMIIEISTSGGFGGLSAAGINKKVDMKFVTDSARSEICRAFDLKKLKDMADKSGNIGSADRITYNIVVVDDNEKRHGFNVNEDVLPAEMLDMIDEF